MKNGVRVLNKLQNAMEVLRLPSLLNHLGQAGPSRNSALPLSFTGVLEFSASHCPSSGPSHHNPTWNHVLFATPFSQTLAQGALASHLREVIPLPSNLTFSVYTRRKGKMHCSSFSRVL